MAIQVAFVVVLRKEMKNQRPRTAQSWYDDGNQQQQQQQKSCEVEHKKNKAQPSNLISTILSLSLSPENFAFFEI